MKEDDAKETGRKKTPTTIIKRKWTNWEKRQNNRMSRGMETATKDAERKRSMKMCKSTHYLNDLKWERINNIAWNDNRTMCRPDFFFFVSSIVHFPLFLCRSTLPPPPLSLFLLFSLVLSGSHFHTHMCVFTKHLSNLSNYPLDEKTKQLNFAYFFYLLFHLSTFFYLFWCPSHFFIFVFLSE